MTIPFNYLRARVDLSALVSNYRLLSGLTEGPSMPVVKADAYGHGLIPVSKALASAGADRLAVGSAREAAALREAFGGQIVCLLGPLLDEDYELIFSARAVPLVGRMEQIDRLAAMSAAHGPLEIALKFDTGMSRLGFPPDEAGAALERLSVAPGLVPVLAASHLSTADEVSGQMEGPRFADLQAERFAALTCRLSEAGIACMGSLANSAGLLRLPGGAPSSALARLGIALYGANPFAGTPWADLGAGLRPAMSVVSRVLAVREVAPGEGVSYGRTFVADRPMRVAWVAAGYADAYSRALSSRPGESGGGPAHMLVAGRRAPILGRVCMQMTALDVSGLPDVHPGDEVFLLGGEGERAITPGELAGWWRTIPYEVFCLLGLNEREYRE